MDFVLDRLLNFPNITVEQCRIEKDKINLNIGFINDIVICPFCKQTTDQIHQKRNLSVKDLPILGLSTILEIERRQYSCQNCQKYFTESLDFIDFERHSTNRYKQYIYERVKSSNITQITREENLSYDRVKSIFENQFTKKKEVSSAIRISIDEFSHRKGYGQFATVICDIENKTILEVIDSHKQDDIIKTLSEWSLLARLTVREVSIDMWGGFTKVIQEVFPKAQIVYDRFHVMKATNNDLKKIIKQCKAKIDKLKIKQGKYLLLKNRDRLNEAEKENLEKILACSQRLRSAYELKEEFRQIYEDKQTPENAKSRFAQWMQKASNFYTDSIKTLSNHIDGICNYFENRTTSGVMEGINNKIKLIKRQAYGFINFEHLRMRLIACFSN